MRAYTTTSFVGHYPVGTSAVVVARDRRHAKQLLLAALDRAGLPQSQKQQDDIEFKELNVGMAQAVILQDGNY